MAFENTHIDNIPDELKFRKGSTHTPETRKRMSEARRKFYARGGIHPRQGKKLTTAQRKRLSVAHIGIPVSEETKEKLSELRVGSKHWNWQGGITKLNRRIRNSRKWKLWRKSVFERDSYTCQECYAVGVYIEAHHIVPVRRDDTRLFLKENGITLCRPCHIKTLWKESNFEERYAQKVAAHGN